MAPFSLFEFAPAGLVVVASGVLFMILVGWRAEHQVQKTAEQGLISFTWVTIIREDV